MHLVSSVFFSWSLSLKLLVVKMAFFITYLMRKADRLSFLKVRLFLASPYHRDLLVVFLMYLFNVLMAFCMFQWKEAVLNVACVCVKLSGGNCDRVILWIYECTRRARIVGLGGWGSTGLAWSIYNFIFRYEKKKGWDRWMRQRIRTSIII